MGTIAPLQDFDYRTAEPLRVYKFQPKYFLTMGAISNFPLIVLPSTGAIYPICSNLGRCILTINQACKPPISITSCT